MDLTIITHFSPCIGGGHLSRCLTLAECLANYNIQIKWVVNEFAGRRLKGLGFDTTVVDFPFDTENIDNLVKSDCFLVDSYEPTYKFYKRLGEKGSLIVIDDFRDRPVEKYADIVINYNLGAEKIPYIKSKSQLFLLGPEYSLIRKEFRNLKPSLGDYCLFVAGSADIRNTSIKIAQMWDSSWMPLSLVVGPLVSEVQKEELKSLCAGKNNVRTVCSPGNFPELIAKARIVICTSSVTAYEALSMKKPVAVFQVADNQVAIGHEIQEQGLGVNLGFWGHWGKEELGKVLSEPLWEPSDVINPLGAKLVVQQTLSWFERGSKI